MQLLAFFNLQTFCRHHSMAGPKISKETLRDHQSGRFLQAGSCSWWPSKSVKALNLSTATLKGKMKMLTCTWYKY